MEESNLSRTTPKTGTLSQGIIEAGAQWSQWRSSRRRALGIGMGGGLALAALAQGGYPVVAAAAAQEEEPVVGGSLSMSLADSDVQNFDPIVPTDNMSIWTMLLIYEQLIRVAPDGTSLEPGLAESWERSEDGLSYTFTLRDSTFHDGNPVTGEDVAYSLTRAAFDETSTWKDMVSVVEAVTAVDEKTVEITLKNAWVPFEADLALFACSIIPKAAHEAQGAELFQNPTGSGPFKLDTWEKDTQIVLKKNETYWEAGKPYLDEVVLRVLTDANARMLQFQGGEIDIATSVPYSQLESLSADENVVVLQDAVARFDYIGMNNKRAPWDDKNLRQAINYAVDKQTIIDRILFGNGQIATSYLPLMAGNNPESAGYPFDLDKAKELVANSAGKDGFQAELIIGAGDPVADQIGQLIAANMSEIGGEVTLAAMESGASRQKVRVDLDYDWTKSYYTTDIIDPDQLTAFAVNSEGGTQAIFTQYEKPEVNALCDEAAVEFDPAARQEIYNQIQAMHLDDAPMIFLFYPQGGTVTNAAVKNFKILPTGNYRLWETWKAAE
jgi:peptide/nickel transport system substrate-binding protein